MADRNPFIPNERRMDMEFHAHSQQDYMEDENTRTFHEAQAKEKQDAIQERMTQNEQQSEKREDIQQSLDNSDDAPDNAASGQFKHVFVR